MYFFKQPQSHVWTRTAQPAQQFAMGWTLQGSKPLEGDIFPHQSRPAVGPTQPPVQLVLGHFWG